MVIEPFAAGNLIIAGDLDWNLSGERQLFLLKLNPAGAPLPAASWTPTEPENPGWVVTGEIGNQDVAAGLVVRRMLQSYQVLVLSAFERPCGSGMIVYGFWDDGATTSPPRTWTHGGGSNGIVCDSIEARDMALVGDPADPLGDYTGTLAIVGRYLSRHDPDPNTPQSESAMLLTLDPGNLQPSPGEEVQLMLSTGHDIQQPYDPTFWFNAVRYHPDQRRLLAVGGAAWEDPSELYRALLVARLKQAPLFADGFEGD